MLQKGEVVITTVLGVGVGYRAKRKFWLSRWFMNSTGWGHSTDKEPKLWSVWTRNWAAFTWGMLQSCGGEQGPYTPHSLPSHFVKRDMMSQTHSNTGWAGSSGCRRDFQRASLFYVQFPQDPLTFLKAIGWFIQSIGLSSSSSRLCNRDLCRQSILGSALTINRWWGQGEGSRMDRGEPWTLMLSQRRLQQMPQGALQQGWPFKIGAWAGFIPPLTTGYRLLWKGPAALGKAALFRQGKPCRCSRGCQHSQQLGNEHPVLREDLGNVPQHPPRRHCRETFLSFTTCSHHSCSLTSAEYND